MASVRSSNPLFGEEPFKVGVFAYLHEGGMTLTKAPERWTARWPDIAELAKMADQGGLDFMLPISSWRGWRGEIDHRLWCYETLTHAAALSGLTKRIALLSTVHAPLVHPVYVAKALATVDHASNGRAGLNIVCGWQAGDFKMFGVEQLEHDKRYDHGFEWYEILKALLAGPSKPFNYQGKYFKSEGLVGQPASLQQPHPAILSAAYSPAGRNYAIRTSDFLLTSVASLDGIGREIEDIRARESEIGRTNPLGVIGSVPIVCRETRKEAQEFNRYFAYEQADKLAVDQYLGMRASAAASPTIASEEAKRMRAAGGGTLVGTPEDIVEGLLAMKQVGFAGVAMLFLNYTNDLPFILDRVLPLLKQAGLRLDSAKGAA